MKPYLKNNQTDEVVKALTRRLTAADLEELMLLQQSAVGADAASLYIPHTRANFTALLETGEILGIFTDAGLCGACSVNMPGTASQNLGHDLDMSNSDLPDCAVIDSLLVAPAWRGNGIARELIRCCIRRAVETMGARFVLAAVSPKNIGCILSFMSINNVRIKALRQKHGCKLRYILCYTHEDRRLFTVYERYEIQDVYQISRALANRYEGIATFKNDEGVFVWLAK
jgi:ribosomal protein S18 acetylase RimI-like enzyme